MSEETPPKKSDAKLFMLIGLLLVGLGIAYSISLGPLPEPVTETEELDVAEVEQAFEGDKPEPQEEVVTKTETVETETPAPSATIHFDLATAKKERILGDPSAPIKITEYSSLTCGHCGKFHKNTFDDFKAAYIDTGKAYLVFSDFPLNAPALHASMIARCLPEDAYFGFIKNLFETQDDWAYKNTYMDYLEEKAAESGLGADGVKECLNTEELQDSILKRIEAIQKQWAITSTPSFMINNQIVISGAKPFEKFDEEIQAAVKKIDEGG